MGGVYCGGFDASGNRGVKMTNSIHPITVPLYFWFCRNPGLALPLIALQYHEVKIHLTLGDASSGFNPSGGEVNLWCDYIYLDTDERRRFAQVSHEYLIEQLQFQTIDSEKIGSYNLNFNHPVKELIWTGAWLNKAKPGADTTAWGRFDELPASNIDHKFGLKLNGHERFEPQCLAYFARTQVLKYHSGWGGVGMSPDALDIDDICVYSFALKPEEHQPSGTCNFSRIDSAQFEIVGAACSSVPNMYAVNYNVLRIMSGMGGLAYSN
tara:strand:+ start:149 stop:949 length:801 start_codon:yes stop_codon:yes gene_type:complete